jgi:hypothetical protein
LGKLLEEAQLQVTDVLRWFRLDSIDVCRADLSGCNRRYSTALNFCQLVTHFTQRLLDELSSRCGQSL